MQQHQNQHRQQESQQEPIITLSNSLSQIELAPLTEIEKYNIAIKNIEKNEGG